MVHIWGLCLSVTSTQIQLCTSSHNENFLICHFQLRTGLLWACLRSTALMTLFAGDYRIVCLIAQRIKHRGCFATSGKYSFMEQLSEEHQGSAGWRSPSAPTRLLARTDALLDSKATNISAT